MCRNMGFDAFPTNLYGNTIRNNSRSRILIFPDFDWNLVYMNCVESFLGNDTEILNSWISNFSIFLIGSRFIRLPLIPAYEFEDHP